MYAAKNEKQKRGPFIIKLVSETVTSFHHSENKLEISFATNRSDSNLSFRMGLLQAH